MKKKLALLLFCLTAVVGIAQDRTIKGKVTDGKSPLENVNIQVVDKGISTYTDADGNYEIAIATGDRLEYSYNGMRTISIKIEDVTRKKWKSQPVIVVHKETWRRITPLTRTSFVPLTAI